MEENKAYVSRVKLTDGTVYEIKDAEAQEALSSLFDGVLILDCGTASTNIE